MMHVMVDAVNICLRSLHSLVVVFIAADLVSTMPTFSNYRKRGKIHWAKFSRFLWFSRALRKFPVNIYLYYTSFV